MSGQDSFLSGQSVFLAPRVGALPTEQRTMTSMALGFGFGAPAYSARRQRSTLPAIRPRILAHGGGSHDGHGSSCSSCGSSRKASLRTATSSGAFLAVSAGLRASGVGGTIAYGLPLAASVVLAGIPAAQDTWQSIRRGDIGVEVLMTAAAGAALISGAPFEGALLLSLFALSHAAEQAVTARARSHLDHLETVSPDTAQVLVVHQNTHDPEETTIAADHLKPGDRVVVRHSELLPADAVLQGEPAYWSLAHLTGEATPKRFVAQDVVPAGAILMPPSNSLVTLSVKRAQKESSLARINNLVHHASSSRSQLHSSLLTTFGKVYSKAVMVACLLISLWPSPSAASLTRGLSVLIAASPCALVVGAPVAYVAALTAAVRRGVLVKHGPKTLEKFASASHIAFDKTGTLTTGKLQLDKVLIYRESAKSGVSSGRSGQETALSIAYAMEHSSPSHPVADAILVAARERKLRQKTLRGVVTPIPGQGLTADIDRYSIGRLPWVLEKLDKESERAQWLYETANSARESGNPVTTMIYGDGGAAVFVFADTIRPEASSVLEKLRGTPYSMGLSILTGDRASAAATVAQALDFEPHSVSADCSPEQKLEKIRSGGDGLVMVGDGINDAPALAAASSSVSMGLDNATAVSASDVVLTRSNLDDLRWLLAKSRSARNVAWQNVILGLCFMVLTATPALMGLLPLWASVLLHEGGTLLVGLNGLRLLSDRLS